MYQELNRKVSHRQPYPFGKKGYAGNSIRMRLDHVQAESISYFVEPMDENFFEVAFFKNGNFVTELVSEFESYAEPDVGDTRVYRFVEKDVLENFLKDHAVSEIR
jgi:hypothetical protein